MDSFHVFFPFSGFPHHHTRMHKKDDDDWSHPKNCSPSFNIVGSAHRYNLIHRHMYISTRIVLLFFPSIMSNPMSFFSVSIRFSFRPADRQTNSSSSSNFQPSKTISAHGRQSSSRVECGRTDGRTDLDRTPTRSIASERQMLPYTYLHIRTHP